MILAEVILAGSLAFGAPPPRTPPRATFVPMTTVPPQESLAPNPQDVASIDDLILAFYAVSSGGAHEPRDWRRYRSLFHWGAQCSEMGENGYAPGVSIDRWVEQVGLGLNNIAYHQTEIARRIQRLGNFVQVYSTFVVHGSDRSRVIRRGVNAFQLVFEDNRWWIASRFIYFEEPNNRIPPEFLLPPASGATADRSRSE